MNYKEKLESMNESERKSFDEMKKKSALEYKMRLNKSKEIIQNWLSTDPKGLDPKLIESLNYLSGSGVRSSRTNSSKMKDLFIEKKEITLKDIFGEFEIGYPSMKIKMNNWINSSNVNDRFWVSYDEKKKLFSYHGTSEKAPEGYVGNQPKIKVIKNEL